MKHILTLILLVTFPTAAFCQNDSLVNMKPQGSDLRIEIAGFGITPGNKEPEKTGNCKELRVKTKEPRVTALLGLASLDFGFNTLTGNLYKDQWAGQGDFLNMVIGKSNRFAWEVAAVNIAFDRKAVCSLTLGVRLSADNYRFYRNITLDNDASGSLMPVDIDHSVKKTKMVTSWVGIPVRLTFRIARDLRISLMASGDVLMNAHTKHKKPKTKDYISGIEPWRVRVGGTITYHKIGIFCDWTATPLFTAGSDAKTLSLGLRIGI